MIQRENAENESIPQIVRAAAPAQHNNYCGRGAMFNRLDSWAEDTAELSSRRVGVLAHRRHWANGASLTIEDGGRVHPPYLFSAANADTSNSRCGSRVTPAFPMSHRF